MRKFNLINNKMTTNSTTNRTAFIKAKSKNVSKRTLIWKNWGGV